jgi:hypothetical protein
MHNVGSGLHGRRVVSTRPGGGDCSREAAGPSMIGACGCPSACAAIGSSPIVAEFPAWLIECDLPVTRTRLGEYRERGQQ